MPLCVPRVVQNADWVTVKQDAHFMIQKHVGKYFSSSPSTPSLRFRKTTLSSSSSSLDLLSKSQGTYRILMRCNKICLGEFTDRKDLLNQWMFLHPADSDLAFDVSGQESMQRLWQSQMESLQNRDVTQSEQDFVRTPLSRGKSWSKPLPHILLDSRLLARSCDPNQIEEYRY